MDYLDWNEIIAQHFFSPDKAGQRVLLYVTRELISNLGNPEGVDSFIRAAKLGSSWGTKQGICANATASARDWRSRDLEYPPYLGYLALFVAAANLEGDFAPHAYYPRLRALLDEAPSIGQYRGFDSMCALWNDLEVWSNVDKAGEWGIFRHQLYGKWIHVGLPVAQTLLSEDDLHALPDLFAQVGFDPAAPPSDADMMAALSQNGQGHLRHKTLELIKSVTSLGCTLESETQRTLLEILFSELREWDGSTKDATSSIADDVTSAPDVAYSGTLRLCCSLDRIAGQAHFVLRCKTATDFPEDGFVLSSANLRPSTDQFVCEEWGNGWSSPLKRRADRKVADASTLDWYSGVKLEDQVQGWTFRWRSTQVRILINAQNEGFSGYCEVYRLPSNAPFLLLVQSNAAIEIASWGQNACEDWREIRLSQGLLSSWRMFEAQRARDDTAIRKRFPMLTLPSGISLIPHGGIRVGQGNRYFDFALPAVEVSGVGDIIMLCNGQLLAPDAEGRYPISTCQLPTLDNQLLVEAERDGEAVGRVALYVAREGWSWKSSQPSYWLNTSGKALDTRNSVEEFMLGAAGAAVRANAPAFDFNGVIPLLEEGAVHYVGRSPGQIVHWPQEPRPTTWQPVWVITSRRRGQAIFCGTDVDAATPIKALCSDRKALKEWREFLWFRRKDILPPSQPHLKKLWEAYQEMAHNV